MNSIPVKSVRYENYSSSCGVVVERLATGRAITKNAPGMRRLVARAYTDAHEMPNGPLPPGTVELKYGDHRDGPFAKRALEHYRLGSQYWVIKRHGSIIVGLVKVSPGEILDPQQPNTLYINDVVVDPGSENTDSSQRKGYAATMLHAALSFGGHDPNRAVSLEAFEASEGGMTGGRLIPGPNELYRGMGLVRIGGAEPFDFQDREGNVGHQLLMCEYRTPPELTLAGVVRALEQRKPELRTPLPLQQ